MSYQEGRVLAYIFSTCVGVGVYAFYGWQHSQAEGFDPAVITSFWGAITLISILVTVVLSVVVTIIVSIAQAIIERDDDPMLSDERDQLIELKAERLGFSIFGIGFLISMGVLALGGSQVLMLNLIVCALFGSGIAGYMAQLYFHRRGF